jgi:DNA-binding XRE family transcriptional regulator
VRASEPKQSKSSSVGGNSTQFGLAIIKSPQADIILSLTAMVRRNMLSAICNLMMEQRDMLTTGNQLKAARALVGINQGDLAKAARINVATISAMEGKGRPN